MADATLVAEVVDALDEYERESAEVTNIWALEALVSKHSKRVGQVMMRRRLEGRFQAAPPPSGPDASLP